MTHVYHLLITGIVLAIIANTIAIVAMRSQSTFERVQTSLGCGERGAGRLLANAARVCVPRH
jgi:hypothetical protein